MGPTERDARRHPLSRPKGSTVRHQHEAKVQYWKLQWIALTGEAGLAAKRLHHTRSPSSHVNIFYDARRRQLALPGAEKISSKLFSPKTRGGL